MGLLKVNYLIRHNGDYNDNDNHDCDDEKVIVQLVINGMLDL